MRILQKEDIFYEDSSILVCRKPAGLAVQTASAGTQDLVSLVKNYLRTTYLGVIHRLDQPVEGILVFAKTQKAAADLGRQNREHQMGKRYYAVAVAEDVTADTDAEWQVLEDFLKKEERGNVSRVTEAGVQGSKLARLRYQRVEERQPDSPEESSLMLVRVELETGRHHQIRVQLAHKGMPLLGDVKYGTENSIRESERQGIREVALCCYELEFRHPVTKKEMKIMLAPSGRAFQFFPVNSFGKRQ